MPRLVFLKEFTVFSVFEQYFVLRSRTLFTSNLTGKEYEWLKGIEGQSSLEATEEQVETLRRLKLLSDAELTPEARLEYDRALLEHAQSRSFVRLIELMVAQGCNMSCTYCYGSKGEYGHRGMMTKETAFKAIDFLRDELAEHDPEGHVKPTVVFIGGEPLLAADLIRECVLYAESIWGKGNVGFGTTTNLTLMTEELLDFFIEHKVSIVVSFDGTPELQRAHRRMSNGQDSYELIMEKIKMVLAKAPNSPCRATRYIDEDEKAIEAGIKSLGFKSFEVHTVSGILGDGTASSDSLRNYEQQAQATLEYARAFVEAARKQDAESLRKLREDSKAVFEMVASMLHHPAAQRCTLHCTSGRAMAAVAVDGTMHPCHRFVGSEFKLGTLDNFDRQISHKHPALDNPKCRACAYRYGCGHPCLYICACDAPDEPGVDPLLRAPQAYCDLLKAQIHARTYLHASLSPDELHWLRQARRRD